MTNERATLPSRTIAKPGRKSGSSRAQSIPAQANAAATCACGGECPRCKSTPIQAKLAVGAAGDRHEREADRIAEQMSVRPTERRGDEPPRIGRYSAASSARVPAPFSVQRALAARGAPLQPALRRDMERRFGRDFSGVRVHTGVEAEESAAHVDARAYTHGADVVFAAGQYEPHTARGRKLIAHELTHVAQQDDGRIPMIQRDKAEKPAKRKKSDDFSVELDHGVRGKYLIYFERPRTREEVLQVLFLDGTVPAGYKLEEVGVTMMGWAWRFITPAGVVDIDTYPKLTPAFQERFSGGVMRLTGEESQSIHARSEAFMDSRPPYLPGQSVREAFETCKDNKIGEGPFAGCWGKRAGFFYYIGWQSGYTGRVLEVKTSPTHPQIIKDWEWWLNQGYTLNDTAREEEQLQLDILKMTIFAYASALSAAPGAVRRPTVPTSPVAQAGRIVSTGTQAYGAWKVALGKDLTPTDVTIMGLGAVLEAGTQLFTAKPPPNVKTPKTPPIKPTPDAPAPQPVLGSKGPAHWTDTPTVTPNPAQRLKPGQADVTDINQYSKQKAAVDKIQQAQQAAAQKVANTNQAVDVKAKVAVGQNVTPSAQGGDGPYATAGSKKPPSATSVTVGKVSSSRTGGAGANIKRDAPAPPANKNLVPEYPVPPRALRNYSNKELLDFYKNNYGKYPKSIQRMIDDLPTGGGAKTPSRKRLEAIDRAIRDQHTQEANKRVASGSADQPFTQSKRASGNEGERFNAALTGNKRLNLTGRTKSGELVEFDSVRLAEHRILETKMNLSPYTTSGDVMDQMRRQATFAEDWGFSQVRWEVYDHDSYLTAKDAHDALSDLNPALGSRIDVTNPSDAFR